MFHPRLYFCCMCLFLMGCASYEIQSSQKDAYIVLPPSDPWQPLSTRSLHADYAFHHPMSGSAFYVRSDCHLYKDATLHQLTKELVSIFESPHVISRKDDMLLDRATKETILTGKLDGVLLKIKVIVLKKHSCNFDFVFSSLPNHFEKDVTAYDTFIQTFQF